MLKKCLRSKSQFKGECNAKLRMGSFNHACFSSSDFLFANHRGESESQSAHELSVLAECFVRMESVGLACCSFRSIGNSGKTAMIKTIIDVPYQSGQSAWTGHFGFAQRLVRDFRPTRIVELGVQYGDSYFCMAHAVKHFDTGTPCTAVDTWNGDMHTGLYDGSVFSQVSKQNEKYSEFSILLRMPFDKAAEYFDENDISVLHIDGYHTYDAVKHDYETWNDKVRDIIMFHDTHVFHGDFGVYKFWEELCREFPSSTFEFAHSSGLGILCKNNDAYMAVKNIIKGD